MFDAGERLRGVADMLDTITGARIHVRVEVPAEAALVRADVNQFETAVVNAAVNARDAMDGIGTLTMRVLAGQHMPSIRGHGGSRGPFVAISLTDTGAGIPADIIGRIFEPFFTTKTVGRGTGLGLSQVFGFAKQSGGDVDVSSTVGEGTTFTLYLPEVSDEPSEMPVTDRDAGWCPPARASRSCWWKIIWRWAASAPRSWRTSATHPNGSSTPRRRSNAWVPTVPASGPSSPMS